MWSRNTHKDKNKSTLEWNELHRLVKKKINDDEFGKAVIFLEQEKYLYYADNNANEGVFIGITDEGVSAFASDYFKQKYDELFYNRLFNVILSGCNLILAVAAVYAIWISINKNEVIYDTLQEVQKRLNKVEQESKLKLLIPNDTTKKNQQYHSINKLTSEIYPSKKTFIIHRLNIW